MGLKWFWMTLSSTLSWVYRTKKGKKEKKNCILAGHELMGFGNLSYFFCWSEASTAFLFRLGAGGTGWRDTPTAPVPPCSTMCWHSSCSCPTCLTLVVLLVPSNHMKSLKKNVGVTSQPKIDNQKRLGSKISDIYLRVQIWIRRSRW